MAKSKKIQESGNLTNLPKDYKSALEALKIRIKSAQLKAATSVNRELILLYWDTGKEIVRKQENEGWGKSIVERLASDLRKEFPDLKGFSPANVWRMRAFYLAYIRENENLAQAVREINKEKMSQPTTESDSNEAIHVVSQLPWGHNVTLFQKVKDCLKRLWYAQKTIENGWSRAVLVHQIESGLFERQSKPGKLTNFTQTLPDIQSDLAQEIVKDPYNFNFLSLDGQFKERKLHQGLIQHLQDFLIELGVGFAFVGSEYHLEIGDQDFYIDLLFYHLKLRCFVVIELKTIAFQPEFAGKMNFYLSAVDDLLRHQEDRPTIGIILCQSKNKTVVEYALKDSKKPMGVSAYKLTNLLPEKLRGKLPSVKQIEDELKLS
ncbi:MAG: DUF1016 family protein [Candidatus Omnitrophica bacterium]|nr:DUF1016 family protein [Candidatus Omnitrophota bacterium]